MTVKVVDTTVISASIKEIHSIDLLGLTSAVYDISTSGDVLEEVEKGFDEGTMEHAFELTRVVKVGCDEYHPLMSWLETRYPYLHRGELSSFLLAVLEYGQRGVPCYYVTDDGAMRRNVRKILIEDRFIELLGGEPPSIGMTGTVGLIGRLYERGMMTSKELRDVMEELRSGTFRVSKPVLDHLRRMLDEG